MITNYISSNVGYVFSGNSDQQKGQGYLLLLSEVITLPEILEIVGYSQSFISDCHLPLKSFQGL